MTGEDDIARFNSQQYAYSVRSLNSEPSVNKFNQEVYRNFIIFYINLLLEDHSRQSFKKLAYSFLLKYRNSDLFSETTEF